MTQDFGFQRAKRKSPSKVLIIGLGIMALAAAAVMTAVVLQSRNKAVAHAALWSTDGQPCPTMTAAALSARTPLPTSFDYYDITFARDGGNVTCDQIKSDHGRGLRDVSACKFNAPNILEVKTDKADAIFGPGLFGPVVINVDQGQPSCVIIPRDRQAAMMAPSE